MTSGRRLRRPALLNRILTASAVVIVTAGVSSAAHTEPTTGDLAALRQLALDQVNDARRQHDLTTLSLDPALSEAAQNHAEDMLRHDYYAHVAPDGETVMDRFVAAGGGRWQTVAENIAHCTGCRPPPATEDVLQLHQGWMDSPGHRENILKPGLERFGFGIAAGSDGGLYAVQTFAGPGSSRGTDRNAEAVPVSDDSAMAEMLDRINAARREAGVEPLAPSDPLATAAQTLLPAGEQGDFDLQQIGDVRDAIPAANRRQWRSLSLVSGACGGCGVEPMLGDIQFFADRWLDEPRYRDMLLGSGPTHFGFSIAADGTGRKIALAILGRQR